MDYADERSGSNSTTGSTAGSCASSHASETTSTQGALIFLHAGTYRGEFLVIDSDIALIGTFNVAVFLHCLLFSNTYIMCCLQALYKIVHFAAFIDRTDLE